MSDQSLELLFQVQNCNVVVKENGPQVELFSELENLSDGKSESFFDSIFDSIMNLQYELIVGAAEINSNSFDPAISECTIKNVILVVEASNSLQEMILVFSYRNEFIISHDNTKLLAGLGNLLKSIKLALRLIKDTNTRLIPCNLVKLFKLGQIRLQELVQMLFQGIQVMGEHLSQQVIELALA